MTADELELRAINVVRALAMDAVQRANSGHPGTPMALAPLAHVLFTRVMKYDAADPDWADRDRFVLSAGHASMLVYSMLYLCGLGLELDDLRNFRQWGSKTPGPPREGPHRAASRSRRARSVRASATRSASRSPRSTCATASAPSSATTTCSRSAATATSWRASATKRRRSPATSGSATSSPSTTTTTSRSTARPSSTYTDDVPERFRAYGWHVLELGEVAEDLDALERGLREGMADEDRPTLLVLRSHIGYPSPNFQDTSKAHGEPLGADEVARREGDPRAAGRPGLLRPRRRPRVLPRRAAGAAGAAREAWEARRRASVATANPERAEEFDLCDLRTRRRRMGTRSCRRGSRATSLATRVASQEVLGAIFDVVPGLIGGGGDLTGNTGTLVKDAAILTPEDASGRIIHFGIREHGDGARPRTASAVIGPVAVRRDVLRVQRLHAAVGAARGDDAGQGRVRLVATTRSGSARTARRTNRSSTSPRCGRCPGCG